MRLRGWILLGVLLSPAASAAAQAAPKDGRAVLELMRTAYAGKWYRTLTFVQTTTLNRPDGTTVNQTWYESLRHQDGARTELRIDQGALSTGNGVLYTADSMWVVRNGALAATRADGNVFLPLIEGVYLQPVERTMRELASTNIAFDRLSTGSWDSRPVWIVGAAPGDSVTPQFWVDRERLVVVRVIVPLAPNQPPYDIRIGGYVPAGKGWLGTDVAMLQGGAMRQREVYHDWKVDLPLDAALFDVKQWKTASHWFKAP